jgi:hypothetical protein
MSNTKRKLVTAVTRALKSENIDFERDDDQPGDAIGFDFVLGTNPPLPVRIMVLDERLVAIYLHAGFEIPPERGADVFAWASETNNDIYVGTVEFDVPSGSVLFRHSVDCLEVPAGALTAFLSASWHLAYTSWMAIAPSLLPVLAGQGDFEDDEDGVDEDEGPALPARHRTTRVDAPAGQSADSADEDDEWSEEDEEELADRVQAVSDILHSAAEERFGSVLAEYMDGSLWNLADVYVESLNKEELEYAEVTARVVGSEERSVIVLSAEGTPSLRFRFSATTVRGQMIRDRAGMTLLHAASVDDSRRILAEGFDDAVILPIGDYTIDQHGIPLEEGEREEKEGVLLTDTRLPQDDRVGRPIQLTIHWSADAPSLIAYEALETVYSGTEAWLVVPTVRRWHVPAQVLNEAISDGLAKVTKE